uniref:Uncharacterized protein n=1 Tax=Varanus komodoensis TaxID=61221 RepID=A0A8D2L3L1_VARKO
ISMELQDVILELIGMHLINKSLILKGDIYTKVSFVPSDIRITKCRRNHRIVEWQSWKPSCHSQARTPQPNGMPCLGWCACESFHGCNGTTGGPFSLAE